MFDVVIAALKLVGLMAGTMIAFTVIGVGTMIIISVIMHYTNIEPKRPCAMCDSMIPEEQRLCGNCKLSVV